MSPSKKLIKSTSIWVLACLGIIAILQLGGRFPALIDQFYHRGIFQLIRWAFDYTLGLLPFPTVYLFFILLIIFVFRFFNRLKSRSSSFKIELLRLTRFVSILIFLFYLLWGLNYKQTPVENQVHLVIPAMTDKDIANEFYQTNQELNSIIERLELQNWNLDSLMQIRFHEKEARKAIKNVLTQFGYPTPGKVRGRLLRPMGTLLIWNTAGIYIPFAGEGHVDRGLLPFQYPFVMTHEMAHAYGITDEGSCNFLAYLACREDPNLFIQFGGTFGYWRYVASEYRRSFPERYQEEYTTLHPLLIECLNEVHVNNQKYPEIMPKLRYHAYDQYLKAQGIEEGMRNYSRVVKLVFAWRQTK
jgi:hypothetical protein